jgi:ABC-2 type transport system ATP-binding protein
MSAIELSNVSRWYGNVVAVNDITMTIGPGVTGLLGPNGAGKSTIIHMIAGFLGPSKGTLTVDGRPSWENPGVYKILGLVPERDSVYAFLTGEQFVRATAKLHKLPDLAGATRRAIEMTDMADAADRKISTYSKGMRQRIKVAAALVHDPQILLLDEPFNGIEGRTILFSSHILEEVERLSGTIQVMVAGRLAASGDFRAIRRLMTSRPHVFNVRTSSASDDRRLAAVLVGRPFTNAVELSGKGLQVRTSDFGAFCGQIAALTRDNGIALRELLPTDESLESVFGYLLSDQAN